MSEAKRNELNIPSGSLWRVFYVNWKGEKIYGEPATKQQCLNSIGAAKAMQPNDKFDLEPYADNDKIAHSERTTKG